MYYTISDSFTKPFMSCSLCLDKSKSEDFVRFRGVIKVQCAQCGNVTPIYLSLLEKVQLLHH